MIWPFNRKAKPEIREVGGKAAQKLINACQTLVSAAGEHNATRLRMEVAVVKKTRSVGVSTAAPEMHEWVVEARRKDSKDFMIWSIEHGAWWGPGHAGYVSDPKQAGRYTFDEAVDIVNNPHTEKPGVPNEAIVLASTYQE